jgi:hypothetical protein
MVLLDTLEALRHEDSNCVGSSMKPFKYHLDEVYLPCLPEGSYLSVEFTFYPGSAAYWDRQLGGHLPGDPAEVDIDDATLHHADGTKEELRGWIALLELDKKNEQLLYEKLISYGEERASEDGNYDD